MKVERKKEGQWKGERILGLLELDSTKTASAATRSKRASKHKMKHMMSRNVGGRGDFLSDKEWVVEMRHWNEAKDDRAILPFLRR